MNNLSKTRRKSFVWAAVVLAAAVGTAGYRLYSTYARNSEEETKHTTSSVKYTNKNIALTLSHSILNSQLPLEEILLNTANITFILPPNLFLEDLMSNLNMEDKAKKAQIAEALSNNYKLLRCTNLQGYFNILKNLKPEILYVCADDLGINDSIPRDLHRFIKHIVTVEQNKDDIIRKLSSAFII